MNWKITGVALAAVVTTGCEHPFANGGMRGASPAELVVLPATDDVQAMIASETLHALRAAQAATVNGHPSVNGYRALLAAGNEPALPLAADRWLEAQSVSLQALAERSRSAWLAVNALRDP